MWVFIVRARRKREKRVLSLAQYYHNTSKVSLIIINKINIDIKLKSKTLIHLRKFKKYFVINIFKIFLKFHLNFLKFI